MAKPYDSVRLVFGGTIQTSQEWSCGLTIATLTAANMSSVDQAALADFANDAMAAIKAAFNTAASGSTTALRALLAATDALTFVNTYLYRAGQDQAALQYEPVFGTAIAGSGAGRLPAQSCLVASLRTETPGRRGRGRLYLPETGTSLSSDGQVSSTIVNDVATDVARLIHNITVIGLGDDDSSVVVGSQSGAYKVTAVQVDSEIDIQRRRADKLAPLRVGTVTVPSS